MTTILRQLLDGITGAPRGVLRIFRKVHDGITDWRWYA